MEEWFLCHNAGEAEPPQTHRAVYLVSLTLCDCCVRLQRALLCWANPSGRWKGASESPLLPETGANHGQNCILQLPPLTEGHTTRCWAQRSRLCSPAADRGGSQIFVTGPWAGTLISLCPTEWLHFSVELKLSCWEKIPHKFFNP